MGSEDDMLSADDIPWAPDPLSVLAPSRALTDEEERLRDTLAADLAQWTPEEVAGAFVDFILDVRGLAATLHAAVDVIHQQQVRLKRATDLIERSFITRE